MNRLLLFVATLAIMMGITDAHVYRDHWMKQKGINIDYMHYKAMSSRSRAAVIREQVKVDHISAKQIDFSSIITEKLIDIQRFMFGFLNGTSSAGSNGICSGAAMNFVDAAFDMINYRFVWLPEYSMKAQKAQQDTQDYMNTAYAYCNLNAMTGKFTELFEPGISATAIGRMGSRLLTSFIQSWWYKTNCIIDGYLGDNWYDIGYCSGQMFTVTFDVSLG